MISAASSLPLAGRRVLVTRASTQASALSDLLKAQGADVLELAAIEIVSAPTEAIDAALAHLDTYDWVVFTSTNAVDAVLARVHACDTAPTQLNAVQVAAVGKATAARLGAAGVVVSLIPHHFVAESLMDALVARGVHGKRVLLPRAAIARDTLPDGLRAAGAHVDIVEVYRTVRPEAASKDILEAVRDSHVDIVTFASPSAARHTLELLENTMPRQVAVACIGPITSAAVRERGVRVDIEATESTVSGLVDAIVAAVRDDKGR